MKKIILILSISISSLFSQDKIGNIKETYTYNPAIGVYGYVETEYRFKDIAGDIKWAIVSSYYIFKTGNFEARIEVENLAEEKPFGKRTSARAEEEIKTLNYSKGIYLSDSIPNGQGELEWN